MHSDDKYVKQLILCFIMVSQTFGVCLLGPLIYFIYRKEYLNDNERAMLAISTFLIVMTGIGGWMGQLGYLVGIGYHNVVLLVAARSTQMFRNSARQQNWHRLIELFFTANANELYLLVYAVFFWIAVKITSLKSLSFDMGGGTFVNLIDGWNCTLNELWAIYLIWLLITLLSLLACLFLMAYDTKSDNLYKSYLLKYKLSWDLGVLLFIVGYNYWANQNSSSLMDCLVLYRQTGWARCIWFWGLPASTVLFFYMKQGQFKQVSSDRTENQNELENELNAVEIDRELNERQAH